MVDGDPPVYPVHPEVVEENLQGIRVLRVELARSAKPTVPEDGMRESHVTVHVVVLKRVSDGIELAHQPCDEMTLPSKTLSLLG